jgi:SAM-dependent methyltransferase
MPSSRSWYLDPVVARQKGSVFLNWIRSATTGLAPRQILKTDVFEEANGEDRILTELFPEARLQAGIDIQESTVHQAARRTPGFAPLCADARGLPFEDGAFDIIVSTSTLDHFEELADLRCSLRELARVASPGGVVLVILDNPYNPLYHPLRWITRRGWAPFELGETLSRSELAAELEAAGLEIRSRDYLIHNPRLLSTALFLAVRRLLGRHADGPIRFLLACFNALGRLPTRALTACFSAVAAAKPPAR